MDLAQIFDSLSMATLEEYIAYAQEENLHLEFKCLNSADMRGRDDRRNFACVISGFANAAGGIIVWGIQARNNDNQVDCATALMAIPNVALLVSRLNQLTGEAADPIADGIRNRVVHASATGEGFAATLAPESESGPHMAKLGENRYYKRSGDSFYTMEHFDIADMFGRRRKPQLEFYARSVPANAGQIVVGLVNKGRATAYAPYLRVTIPPPFSRSRYGVDGNGSHGLPFLPAQSRLDSYSFGASTDFLIHPGVDVDIALFWDNNNVTPIPPTGVKICYSFSCSNQPLSVGEHVIPVNALTRKMKTNTGTSPVGIPDSEAPVSGPGFSSFLATSDS
jgi:hypothetical protein